MGHPSSISSFLQDDHDDTPQIQLTPRGYPQIQSHEPRQSTIPLIEMSHNSPQGDEDSSTMMMLPPRNPPKRIGRWERFIIISSFVILAAAIGFLSWLWFEDRERELWRRAMLSGRTSQAITLTGVLIRVAIAGLAVVSTSMIASIAVEKHGVPVSAVAEMSIARFTNSGPQSLFFLLFLGRAFRTPLATLAIILFLFAVASQFTSTLLVMDLRQVSVSSFDQHVRHGFNLQYDIDNIPSNPLLYRAAIDGDGYNIWANKPSLSPIFAESWEQPAQRPEEIDDTGPTYRAFLPMALQSEREALRSYKGMARVFDTRTVCVRPEFTARFCGGVNETTPTMCGNLTVKTKGLPREWLATLPPGSETISSDFACPMLYEVPTNAGNWILCRIDLNGEALPSPLNPRKELFDTAPAHSLLMVEFGSSYFPTNVSNWGRDDLFSINSTWVSLNSSNSGPWLQQWNRVQSWDKNILLDHYLKISWCFDAWDSEIQNLNITASTSSNQTEPGFSWNTHSATYNTTAIRRQLKAVSSDENEANSARGILTISSKDMNASIEEMQQMADEVYDSENTTDPHHNYLQPYREGYVYGQWISRQLNRGRFSWNNTIYSSPITVCASCINVNGDYLQVDSLLGQIFTDTVNKTGSPALALQTLNTVVLRMAYYNQILAFTPTDDVSTVTRFIFIQTPQSIWGFVSVMAIIGGNVVMFLILLGMFLDTSKFSYIGNAWQTIAQVSESRETKRLLEHAALATDKNVERWIKGQTDMTGSEVAGSFMRKRKSKQRVRLSVQDGIFEKTISG